MCIADVREENPSWTRRRPQIVAAQSEALSKINAALKDSSSYG